MYNLYFQFVRLLPASDDTEEKKEIASKFAKISLKLKTTNDKNNIMKESKEIFYDSAFYKLLDSKPYLIGCKNGVVDIQHRLFRKGIHSDYIHNTTNNDYYPLEHYKETKPNVITEIDEFMYQLFPETELREYMWEHLASTIIGTNQNQTFNIYLGVGANGKSKLVELMGKVLGDYKGTVPSTLITQKRTSIGGTSSEVHQLIGKRYAVMQELSKGDTINEGIMKEITGGDPIQCRALFKDSVTFIPQFKLVVCTNTLFDVKSNDDGTWRRIRVCEFKSKFTENPYKDKLFPKEQYPYQFKIDTKLDDKFKEWVPVFFSMLVDVAFVTQGKVKDRPCVLEPTNKYREGQDILLYFCQSNIVEEPSDSGNLKIGIVNDVFKQWITNEYGKNSSISNKELREYMEKKYGKYPKLGWSNLHIVEEEC
jgi:P4 family phage/plasmid primase-like protien